MAQNVNKLTPTRRRQVAAAIHSNAVLSNESEAPAPEVFPRPRDVPIPASMLLTNFNGPVVDKTPEAEIRENPAFKDAMRTGYLIDRPSTPCGVEALYRKWCDENDRPLLIVAPYGDAVARVEVDTSMMLSPRTNLRVTKGERPHELRLDARMLMRDLMEQHMDPDYANESIRRVKSIFRGVDIIKINYVAATLLMIVADDADFDLNPQEEDI